MSATATTAPAVWIGSLAAYNAGHLIGDWYPATEAADVTIADLHRGTGVPYTDDDELWVMDLEHMPVTREMDPLEAQRWGDLYAEVGPEQWPALCAWVRSGSYTAEGHTDYPVLSDFEEALCGRWDSFQDYADELAEDCGLLDGVPEELQMYVDLGRWARDIEGDYTVTDAPTGGVFIFRNT